MIDIRRRRSLRGREYAWANANRLQALLGGAGIAYRHVLELAPSNEIRRLQKAADQVAGGPVRERAALAPAFADAYRATALANADMAAFAAGLPDDGLAALLCVETTPRACHRSLVADELARSHGFEVVHLLPSGAPADIA